MARGSTKRKESSAVREWREIAVDAMVAAEDGVRCRVCGTENSDDARVCGGCKVALRTDTLKGWGEPAAESAGTRVLHELPPSARTEGGQGGDVDDEAREEARFAPGQRVLGVYAIERQVGRGGMGAVYVARDDVSGQRVAVKVLPGSVARERSARERFIQEARALAALDHPGIVPLITFAQEGDDRFLVMKFVDGRALDGRLRAERVLPTAEALRILREVCLALAYAHGKGVVHRDIKPANILLDAQGRVVIVDFGIARAGEGAPKLTQTGMLMGTPQYMSPEQIAGLGVDGRSDLYACGLTLFEMLAGQPPFASERTFEVLRAHVEQPVPDVRAVRRLAVPEAEELDDAVVALVGALLKKDPADRPADGAAVVAILDGHLHLPPPSTSVLPSATLPDRAVASPVPQATPVASTAPALRSSSPPADAGAAGAMPTRVIVRPSTQPPTTSSTSTTSTAPTPTFTTPIFTDQREESLTTLRARPARPWGALALLVVAAVGGAVGFVVVRGTPSTPAVTLAPDAGVPSSDEFTRAVLLSRAQVARESGALDDARVAVDTLLRLQPGDVEALILRAAILVDGANPDEATSTLERLPATLPRPDDEARRTALRARIAAARVVDAGVADPPSPPVSSTSPGARAPSRGPRPSELGDGARRAVSAATADRVQACYTQWVLAVDPGAAGEVLVALEVGVDGAVTATRIRRSAFVNIAFHDCLQDVVRAWRFPSFSGAADTVLHSFRFTPNIR
jgi:serine/threonine-protein kinase